MGTPDLITICMRAIRTKTPSDTLSGGHIDLVDDESTTFRVETVVGGEFADGCRGSTHILVDTSLILSPHVYVLRFRLTTVQDRSQENARFREGIVGAQISSERKLKTSFIDALMTSISAPAHCVKLSTPSHDESRGLLGSLIIRLSCRTFFRCFTLLIEALKASRIAHA